MNSDQFEDYVLSFYNGTDGVYPFNCSDSTIRAAIHFVVDAGMRNETFAADSVDREKVRGVLQALGYQEKRAL